MIAFIDEHRLVYGVEPICHVLGRSLRRLSLTSMSPGGATPRACRPRGRRDAILRRSEIRRVWEGNFRVYGVRKVWRQLDREGVVVARCTTARLMRQMGLSGAIRGKAIKTTIGNPAAPCPRDKVNPPVPGTAAECAVGGGTSPMSRPGRGLSTLPSSSMPSPAARHRVGWRVSRSAESGFVPRCPGTGALPPAHPFLHGLVHHSDRGSQYVSIRYTERLAEAGIEPSVGSVGDSYDNALAETVIGLFKTEVIRRRGPWRHAEAVEFATLEWVDWFNHRRLLEPIGNIPPAEAEARYYAQIAGPAIAA